MTGHTNLIKLLLALLLIGSACTTAVVDSPATFTPAEPSATVGTTPATVTTEESSLGDLLEKAIADLVQANSYAFTSNVELKKGESTTVEITGWIDGANRELIVTSGDQSVTTNVQDGLATVTKGGETIEVPLAEAGDAPSLEILAEMTRVSFSGPTTITGSLSPSALRSTGFDTNGSANVIVHLSETDELLGYELTAANGAWSIDVTFSLVGGDFSS